VTDVSALGKDGQHQVTVIRCDNIADISALGNVHNLTFQDCNQPILDVSALGKVHTLDLSDCLGVTDVSALGNVHTLILRHCLGVTDVSALGHVHTLSLYGCEEVTDVSALGKKGQHTLSLGCCGRVENVGMLGGLTVLNLQGTSAYDVSALDAVQSLFLDHSSDEPSSNDWDNDSDDTDEGST
jgi:hypothetical protein